MSSRKPAAKAARSTTPSSEANHLAAELRRGLADGRLDVLTQDALQGLMAAMCRTYAAQREAGVQFRPLGERSGVTATDVMVTAGELLRAANLQVFELGMWQSWTGR